MFKNLNNYNSHTPILRYNKIEIIKTSSKEENDIMKMSLQLTLKQSLIKGTFPNICCNK
jgi:hypothetical protein